MAKPDQAGGNGNLLVYTEAQGCGAETIFFRSGSRSGSDFQKVSAPAPAPAPAPT
jgi:hypothetical protein